MKVKSRYQCELRGTEYDNEVEAKECESIHITDFSVIKKHLKFHPKKPYPYEITITAEGKYSRDYEAKPSSMMDT